MAIVQNPLIGAARGSAGGVTFQRYNGINVMRRKPAVYIDANTPAQQIARANFQAYHASVTGDLSLILNYLYPNPVRQRSRYMQLLTDLQAVRVAAAGQSLPFKDLPVIGNVRPDHFTTYLHDITSSIPVQSSIDGFVIDSTFPFYSPNQLLINCLLFFRNTTKLIIVTELQFYDDLRFSFEFDDYLFPISDHILYCQLLYVDDHKLIPVTSASASMFKQFN